MDLLFDVTLLADIVLAFFTPIYDRFLLITDHAEIAKVYIKFWF